jgi:hypothetical protein
MEAQRTALVFLTSDDQEVLVDKYELRWTSKVFQDMLADCDTGEVTAWPCHDDGACLSQATL